MNRKKSTFDFSRLALIWALFLAVNAIMLYSCRDDYGEIKKNTSLYSKGKGLFIVNEGNFGNGNGSISFFSLDSLKMYNDIFYSANNRPLGDVPVSITLLEEESWIVVNNSGKIEIVKNSDFSSVTTITGFTSPRFLLKVSDKKAYVSDLYSDQITIVNVKTKKIEGHIPIKRSSEQMVMVGGRVFSAFWSNFNFPEFENNQLMIIDIEKDIVVDSIQVGKEPNSMVLDANNKIWVLCSGGYMSEETATLHRINPTTLQTEVIHTFSDPFASPTSLCINATGDTLLYLNQGIFRMSVTENNLPETAFIPQNSSLFNTLGIDPMTSEIFVTDAIDYQQHGLVLHFSRNGELKGTYSAGIIPGNLCFN
ncbi:MAG TPA: YncE family protein [Bacteroidales bacterium]|nr:MAG: hypothetical protein BWX63_01206 [Bacteroidetes bacterium ADurb.Bin041]HNV49975.1 YncE family protein [Bacteroidales bacterium]HPW43300.1 YncE family protein [Bacteroidales bacterium]